ncbi:cysteine peptidase family C39 domain-containing protein [Dictyobacter kobayashii]|uniref:Peptidase C39 domain-containing protein n=1 Tax=Dictyobacter kobayashii TaxID=2014872 RepID=A0A402AWH8_9CHLR|nr:cysteine peptidase family C39 domain-containing protein [Dictyobacter kobayashii]GCE23491.1 hypothetical protein KDK_72910 [Dictyobacter kobayashii]
MDASEQKTQVLAKEGGKEKKEAAYSRRSIVNKILKKRVPVMLQMSEVECGLACLAMVLSYHGRQTTISELRTSYGASRDGVSALSLVKAARNMGMISRALALQKNDFKDVALPAIIHWEFNHFIIVERWTPEQVTVVDPANGRRQMTAEEFNGALPVSC